MTEPTRWVVIDDQDSRILYSAGWEPTVGDRFNSGGNFGTTYRNSLQGTVTNGASISLSFKGNAARIKGTNNISIDAAGIPDPDWDCIVDDKVVGKTSPFPYFENNWVFCEIENLPAGDHTLGLTIKAKERAFWFNYIEYRATEAVEDEVVWASRDDADLLYRGNWSALSTVAHSTTTRGSSATFKFIGSGISLYGMYPETLPHQAGQATYSIDGGPSTMFTIAGGDDVPGYNRKIFEVTGLSKAAHSIVLTYTSNGDTTPLTISQLYMEGGTNIRAPVLTGNVTTTTNPNGSTIPVANPASSNTSPADSPGENTGGSSSSSLPIGAVVGGILGGLTFLLLLLLVWYARRRRRPHVIGGYRDSCDAEGRMLSEANLPISLDSQAPAQPHPAARSKRRLSDGFHISNPAPSNEDITTATQTEPSARHHPQGSVDQRNLFHQDSGVRLPTEAPTDFVEYPPVYSVR